MTEHPFEAAFHRLFCDQHINRRCDTLVCSVHSNGALVSRSVRFGNDRVDRSAYRYLSRVFSIRTAARESDGVKKRRRGNTKLLTVIKRDSCETTLQGYLRRVTFPSFTLHKRSEGRAARREQAVVCISEPVDVYVFYASQKSLPARKHYARFIGFVLRSVSVVAAKKFVAYTFTRGRIVLQCRYAPRFNTVTFTPSASTN